MWFGEKHPSEDKKKENWREDKKTPFKLLSREKIVCSEDERVVGLFSPRGESCQFCPTVSQNFRQMRPN